MSRVAPSILVCLGLLAAGLGGCGGDDWRELGLQLTEDQQEQSRKAVQARDEMFRALFKRLQGAVTEGGPENAIKVCKTAAPEIARSVGEALGLSIGRTSFKLRNPENAPPAWARAYVEQKTEKPVQLGHKDGRFAALLPIKLRSACLTCHGAQDTILPKVREAIEAEYPDDQAMGFAKGDLRGWFWVEVPAAP